MPRRNYKCPLIFYIAFAAAAYFASTDTNSKQHTRQNNEFNMGWNWNEKNQ